MARTYDLLVRARGDTKDAQRAMKQLQRSVHDTGKRISGAGETLTKGLTLPLVAFGAIGFRKLAETQKQMAQTNAVIKSTGGVANVTAKQVGDLADAIASKTGVDDDAIQSGQNMLLTFKNIRNEAGKGNDVFNQSTEALIDMSTAMGTEPQKAAIQLGKALNDPVKGITALTRVGIQFTDKQRNTINRLVESGNTMKAQKIILAELNSQFGGSAKAYGETLPGALSKFRQAVEVAAAGIVMNLLPAVQKGLEFGNRFASWLNNLSPTTKRVVAIVGALAAALGPVLIVVGNLVIASAALVPVLAAISLPVVGVIAGIVALGVAMVVAYKRSDEFRAIVNRSFTRMRPEVMRVLSSLRATLQQWVVWGRRIWSEYGEEITKVGRVAFTFLNATVGTQLRVMAGTIRTILAVLRGDWRGAWEGLKSIVVAQFNGMKALVGVALSGVVTVIKRLPSALLAINDLIANAGRRIGNAIIDGIIAAIRAGASRVSSALGSVIGKAKPWKGAIPGFARGVITNGPQLALIGDNRSGREAVVPLGASSQETADRERVMRAANLMGGGSVTNNNTTQIVVNQAFYGDVDPFLASRDMKNAIQARLAV